MDADEKAALETSTRRASREYTTAMGVVLHVDKVSGLIIANARSKIKMPKPPIVHIPAQGDEKPYDEENFNDPDYQAEMDAFNEKIGEITARVFYVLGTRIKELPEGFSGPEDNEWVEKLSALKEIGFDEAEVEDIPEDPKSKVRYYYWLKYWGADERDVQQIIEAIMARGGSPVLEAKVAESLDTFRGDEARDSNSGVPSSEQRESRSPTPIRVNQD